MSESESESESDCECECECECCLLIGELFGFWYACGHACVSYSTVSGPPFSRLWTRRFVPAHAGSFLYASALLSDDLMFLNSCFANPSSVAFLWLSVCCVWCVIVPSACVSASMLSVSFARYACCAFLSVLT